MDWNAIGAVGEVGGAIGVIATLLYLSAQIRQNTRATLADSRYAAGQINMGLMAAISNDREFADIWQRGLADLKSLSPEERFRWSHNAYATLDTSEIAFSQWQRKMLSDGDWEKYRVSLANYFTSPGIREYWSETRDAFHPDFQQLVDDLEPRQLGLTTFPSA
jgi:hypothetical protein